MVCVSVQSLESFVVSLIKLYARLTAAFIPEFHPQSCNVLEKFANLVVKNAVLEFEAIKNACSLKTDDDWP